MPSKDNSVASCAQQILTQVKTVVVGKDPVLLWVLAAILARGHILLEDIPGVGKTTMALAFSRVLSLSCSRVQFTPDVLPSDVTGYSVPDSAGGMRYQPGAVLCNLFLADELNRATSRTQSALLEAMEEGQVTVDGVSHPLPKPFTVIATQNPTGAAGTQLLPDSQMDRFMVRLSMGYPSPKDEAAMVLNRQGGNPLHDLVPLMTREDLTAIQDTVEETYLSDSVVNYIVSLIGATRSSPDILRGASPRATLAVTAMAKSVARLRGRDYVTPADVKEVFAHTIAHRLILSPKAEAQGKQPQAVLQDILAAVPAPRLRCHDRAQIVVSGGAVRLLGILYCLRRVVFMVGTDDRRGTSVAVAPYQHPRHAFLPPVPGRGGRRPNGYGGGNMAAGQQRVPAPAIQGEDTPAQLHHRPSPALSSGNRPAYAALRRHRRHGGAGAGLRLSGAVCLPGGEGDAQNHSRPPEAPAHPRHPRP